MQAVGCLVFCVFVSVVSTTAEAPLASTAEKVSSKTAPAQIVTEAGEEIQLHKLAEGVWLHTSYYVYPQGTRFPANGLLVQEGATLTLVDTAWGEARTAELLRLITVQIGLPVTRAVVTHAHGDRVAGVDVLESQGIEVFSHPLTQRLAMASGLPVPNKVFNSLELRGSTTTLGSLEILFPGPAHAPDNLMVWLPEKQILFGGCAVRAASSKSVGNTSHGDLESWAQVMTAVGEKYKNAKVVIPGHGDPGTFELIKHTARLIAEAEP